MTDHDVRLLIDGAAFGEALMLGTWWATGWFDRRADRRRAEKALAANRAALGGVEEKVAKLEARR